MMIDIDDQYITFSQHLSTFIGNTVTIFTTSGGESSIGFTGIVFSANDEFVRLITRIGAPPACPLGNNCNSPTPLLLQRNGRTSPISKKDESSPLGSITDIPIDKIVALVHNTV